MFIKIKNNTNHTLNDATQDGSVFYDIAEFQLPALIKVTSCIVCFVLLTVVLADLAILTAFYRCPRLITPFTIHVIIVTVINLFTSAVYEPIFLTRNLHREVFRGDLVLCSVYKYFQWTSIGMSALQHCIICGDRWLAVLAPNWYRTKTANFGVKATLVAFVYQQLWYMPLFIADVIESQEGPTRLCDFTRVLWYQYVVRSTTVLLPQGFLLFSYPILVFKIWTKIKLATIQPLPTATQGVTVLVQHVRQKRSKIELQLVLWVMSLQIIFWMPFNVMSTLANTRSSLPYLLDANAMAFLFTTCMQILDPVVYLVFLVNLRREVVWQLRQCSASHRSGPSTSVTFERTIIRVHHVV